MFGNQFYSNPAIYENCYCDKKKHKHHKHHDDYHCMEECGEHGNECFTPKPPSPSGPFGLPPGNNLFFIILVIALVFFVRRRYPVAC